MRDLILFSFDCETDLQFYYWKPNVSCVVNLWTWATLNLDFMYLTNWFSCLLLDLPLLPISILSFMSQNLKKFVGSMQGVFYTLPWGFNGEIQVITDSSRQQAASTTKVFPNRCFMGWCQFLGSLPSLFCTCRQAHFGDWGLMLGILQRLIRSWVKFIKGSHMILRSLVVLCMEVF